MSLEALTCPVCYSRYNQTKCLPRMLPKCGHTLCSYCLQAIIQEETARKCPLDKTLFSPEQVSVDDFPTNYTVLHLVEESQKWEICPDHNEEARLMCLTDRCKVCHDCVYDGDHKGHEIKSLKKIRLDLNQEIGELESMLDDIDKQHTKTVRKLEEQKLNLLEVIRNRFQSLRYQLTKKEAELWYTVNSYFDSERSLVNGLYGPNSSTRNSLVQKILDRREISCRQNIFEIIEEKVSQVLPGEGLAHFKQFADTLDHGIQDDIKSLGNLIVAQAAMISQLEFIPSQSFVELHNNYQIQGDQEIFNDKQRCSFNEFTTTFQMKTSNSSLKIISKPQSSFEIKLNPDEWTKVKEVKLELEADLLTMEDKRALHYVWSNLPDISSLKVQFNSSFDSNESLINSFPFVFTRVDRLQSIEISLENTKITDDTVIFLAYNMLAKTKNLRNFYLNLSGLNITDKSLNALAEAMIHSFQFLSHFNLRLDKTNITSQGIFPLLSHMPNVQVFRFDLDRTRVDDALIEMLAKAILPTMKTLEGFELWLNKTEITDKSIIELLLSMPNLKTLILGLGSTEVTDETIEVFARDVLPRMTMLEDLRFYLDHTKVTEGKILQLKKIKDGITNNK